MKIAIVIGSQRSPSASLRVGQFIAGELQKSFSAGTHLLELASAEFGFWDADFPSESNPQWKYWAQEAADLRSSDALVLVFPEWGGMAPPIMKNFMLLASKEDVGDKPALLVSVSSGMGGAYPISEMRASASKNNRICLIPDHMIFRHVNQILPNATTCAPEIRDRLHYHLRNLLIYARELVNVREALNYDPSYRFGL